MRPRSIVTRLGARPLLRPNVYHNARARCFNAPQVRSVSNLPPDLALFEQIVTKLPTGCLNLCWGLFEMLHNCGLSWALAIPAGAAVVRGLVIMPLLQIPARKALQREFDLLPLSHAHVNIIRHKSRVAFYARGPRQARTMANRLTAALREQLRERWGTERYKQFLPLCSLPIFLAMAETIRKMVGHRSGLWGMIFGSAQQPDAPSDTLDSDKALSNTLDVDKTPSNILDLDKAPSDPLEMAATWKGTTSLPESLPASTEWLQPSLATEGALWFPDLMAPDPLVVLPFVVSGLTMATLYLGSKPLGQATEKRGMRILRRVLMTGALAIGPLTLNVPAGVMLYWSASTTCAFLSHMYLDRFHKLRVRPTPCRNSMHYYMPSERGKA